jgi:hypothetical protein
MLGRKRTGLLPMPDSSIGVLTPETRSAFTVAAMNG